MSTSIILAVLVLLLLTEESAGKCESLKNVQVEVRTDLGKAYNTTVNGCIERAAFEDVILKAYVKNQAVQKLDSDSVRNMKHLHSIQFYRCQLDTIEPGAFRNVPNLRSVQIVANELRRVPEGVFQLIPNLEILKLNRNRIDAIEDGAFRNVTTLRKVYLENNLLERWSSWWFSTNVNLQVVNLQFNRIKTLPRRAFQGLNNLREIYFDYNDLDTISEEAFLGVKQLDYLGLKYNRLKSIDSKVFPVMTIKTLTIEANYLNFLSKRLLEKIDVRELALDGNPWKCPCLNEITSRLHRINATLKSSSSCRGDNVPVCSFPSSQPSLCTETVDEEVSVTYFETVRAISPPIDKYCARLDY